MALPRDPKDQMREIEDAERLRDLYLDCFKTIVGRWVANHYRTDHKTKPTLENAIQGYIHTVLPQVVSSHPQASVEPERSAEDLPMAQSMEASINFWGKKFDYRRKVLCRVARDLILGWGVTMCGYGPRQPGAERYLHESSTAMPAAPWVRWLPQDSHYIDPNADAYELRRFEGHCSDEDKDELLKDPAYQPWRDVIEGLTPNTERRKRAGTPFEDIRKSHDLRKCITVYRTWYPEWQEIHYLAKRSNGDGVLIRKEKYVGPPEGPYNLWGVFEVPGQLYPLSPVAAVYEQIDDLNVQAHGAQQGANRYKRFAVYDKKNVEDGKAVQTVKHGGMLGLTFPGSFEEAEIGGVSAQQLTILEMLRDRVDRNLGQGDAQRGKSNDDTATANQLAQQGSDLRVEWVRQAAVAGVEHDYRKTGWYFWNQDTIAQTFVTKDEQSGQLQDNEYYGGEFDQEFVDAIQMSRGPEYEVVWSGTSDWSDYNLSVLESSLEKVSDPVRQLRAQEDLAFVFDRLLPLYGPMGVNIGRAIDDYGETRNQKELSKRWLMPGAIPLDPLASPGPMHELKGGMAQGAGQYGAGTPQPPQPQQQMGGMGAGPSTMGGMMQQARTGTMPRG